MVASPEKRGSARPDATKVAEAFWARGPWFEPNLGQADDEVLYLARTTEETVLFKGAEASVQARATQDRTLAITIRPVGHSAEMALEAGELLSGKSSYYAGSDPEAWVENVPHHANVVYRQVYPGIDLAYRGNQGRLEYDFHVAPGADPDLIELEFEGIDGLETDPTGDLLLHTAFGMSVHKKPYVYQVVDGQKREIAGRYAVVGERRIKFEIANYDPDVDLVIDPILFSSFFGAVGSEGIPSISIGEVLSQDEGDDVWITGALSSEDGNTRAFVAALSDLEADPGQTQDPTILFLDNVTLNDCTHLDDDRVACAGRASFGAPSTPAVAGSLASQPGALLLRRDRGWDRVSTQTTPTFTPRHSCRASSDSPLSSGRALLDPTLQKR